MSNQLYHHHEGKVLVAQWEGKFPSFCKALGLIFSTTKQDKTTNLPLPTNQQTDHKKASNNLHPS
jgi:hypothetical protein